jgi:hypothetical protein
MYDKALPEKDTVLRQLTELKPNKPKAMPAATAQLAGKRVRVNLYQRGIFRSRVFGTCDISPSGVSISAETPLTQGRRCLSHFELTAKDVAAFRPLESPEADFDLQLELDCIEWEERVEKLPLPRAKNFIRRNRSWHHLPNNASPDSGEP